MASSRPLPIGKPPLLSQLSDTKIDYTTSNNAYFTTKQALTSLPQATHSTMGRSPTSISQWAMDSTRRPSGSDSTTMGPYPVTTACRGPTSNPISSTCMCHLTTVSIPLLRHSQPGSDICSLVLAGTSRSYSKQWPTLTTGAWPVRSCATANSTMTSRQSQSKSSNTNTTSTPFEHGLCHVSPALCSLVPPNEWPLCKMCRGSSEQYVQDGRGVVAHCMASISTLRH
jgi:hypothetical protein